ncbi:hypothetical protein KIN20_022762 [Parelaphostrongylus tenuis]|uniref:acid phosphatase n=1 Tax=Parelaphostrongylus tenuis TaxID=148309 RepID=A0AAD5N8B9_PARTN|nr:hypothetical protein KIN20_022762 [Parelaphostrongylus tenuis]
MAFLILLYPLVTVVCEELILVQTVFRHGDRASTEDMTSAQASAYFYRGKSHLTNKGLDQAHKLGLSLRRRYVENEFLDARYLPSEVEFRSSAAKRCLMTASATASAMFNRTEDGHPTAVAIFTVPKENHYICAEHLRCPSIIKEMKKIVGLANQSVDLDDILNELYAQEAEILNFTHIVGRSRIQQFSPIFYEHRAGLAVPQWFNAEARKEADQLLDLTTEFLAGTGKFHNPRWILTRSGKMLYTLLNNQRKAAQNLLNGTRFFGFVTHDVVVSALLDSMRVLNVALAPQRRPDFVAAVVFELWKKEMQHYVKVLYRRNTESDEFINLTPKIERCGGGEVCDMEVLEEAVRCFQTNHPEVLCGDLMFSSCYSSLCSHCCSLLLLHIIYAVTQQGNRVQSLLETIHSDKADSSINTVTYETKKPPILPTYFPRGKNHTRTAMESTVFIRTILCNYLLLTFTGAGTIKLN